MIKSEIINVENNKNNPIRILLYLTYGVSLRQWSVQGILSREVQLYRELREKNVTTSIVSFGDHTDLDYIGKNDGISVYPRYLNCKRNENTLFRALESLKAPMNIANAIRAADLLKSNQLWGNWQLMNAKRKFGKKWLARIGFEKERNDRFAGKPWYWIQLIHWLSYFSFKMADHVIVPTLSIAEYLEQRYNIEQKKISVIGTPVDTNLFSPVEQRSKKQRCVFVGRLSEEKNVALLINASKISKIGVDIIGNGPLRETLQEQAHKLNADVKFIGTIKNEHLGACIKEYGCCILCSKYEGSPKVVLEAMACGLPVIGTNVPGIADIVIQNTTGLLCRESVGDLAESMSSIIGDEARNDEMGKRAREFILRKHTFKNASELEYEIMKSLCYGCK